jgi:hypothetical protein
MDFVVWAWKPAKAMMTSLEGPPPEVTDVNDFFGAFFWLFRGVEEPPFPIICLK